MRISRRARATAVAAAAALALTACGGDGDDAEGDPAAETEEGTESEDGAGEGEGDAAGDGQAAPDPSENIEDGVYYGNGVALPVPDGFSIEPAMLAQGLVAAVSEDGSQQLTAQAIDMEEASQSGSEVPELDELLESVRSQVGEEPDTDEEVELANAERAQQLTFTNMPGQQEGAPETSTSVVLAESGDGLVGEFTYSAEADSFDDATADVLVADAGFDPDSEPPEMPQQGQPAPAPEGGQPAPEGGAPAPEGGESAPEGGAPAPEGGESSEGGEIAPPDSEG